jgi:signal transduction histidine kinase
LNLIRRIPSRVPAWAFIIVLIVVAFHCANLYQLSVRPLGGETENLYGDHYIIDHIMAGGPVDKAGIKLGDTIVSFNGYQLEEWVAEDRGQEVGDTIWFGMIYNSRPVEVPVVITSSLAMYPAFYLLVFIIFVLVSIGSLFILYKKPHDKPVILFFLIIQQFAVLAVGGYVVLANPVYVFLFMTFLIWGGFIGPTLVHFHLVFPKPVPVQARFRYLPAVFYIIAAITTIANLYSHFKYLFFSPDEQLSFPFERISGLFLTLMFVLALSIAIYQLIKTKDTLIRNQLRIVVLGTFFGLITDILFFIFYNRAYELWEKYPNLVQISQGTGSLIMIVCLLIAIFRFRIWNIEIVLKKALLYVAATLIIIISYLGLLYLVEKFVHAETNLTRFIILSLSVILFLILRDWLQRLIDRMFSREAYDSATVVSDFEERLAGMYKHGELASGIAAGLDGIFHFRSFALNVKKNGRLYEPVVVIGNENCLVPREFETNGHFEEKLARSKVFSPLELEEKPAFLEDFHGELVIPILHEGKPYGFFLCGPKKSEKVYSMQDIRVLSLVAKRVFALFQTAVLYQKDLERQLELERERARISQDMHDDIGAGLTKIAMLSEAVNSEKRIVNNDEQAIDDRPKTWNPEPGTQERIQMQKVAATAREMINSLNVIVWALNPRNDNLDSLVSYTRRYFGEYLENFGIGFRMEAPDDIPDLPVTPDFRRNVFYAMQEAIHNAVKHGKCTEIRLELKLDHQSMHISITDNGKGFDQAKPGSGGNGLLNMQKRAEELGGTFAIESEPGKGTRVTFAIVLSPKF